MIQTLSQPPSPAVIVLMTGRGTSGSFVIRGEQLGRAMGATAIPEAPDIGPFDLAVVVKRASAALVERIHAADVPLVWDVVDAWPQPHGNQWPRDDCVSWLRDQVRSMRPAGIVAATQAMADDCAEFGLPVTVVPHHARPGQARNPIRDDVLIVGYEGAEHYITRWRDDIERECMSRGWRLEINPESLSEVDIVLALRDQDGYAPRRWKSGVKLANAMGSGTPIICCREAGYEEQAIGSAVKWADNAEELRTALDALTPHEERRRCAEWLWAVRPRLDVVAGAYADWIHRCFATASRF